MFNLKMKLLRLENWDDKNRTRQEERNKEILERKRAKVTYLEFILTAVQFKYNSGDKGIQWNGYTNANNLIRLRAVWPRKRTSIPDREDLLLSIAYILVLPTSLPCNALLESVYPGDNAGLIPDGLIRFISMYLILLATPWSCGCPSL
jgi:hypothetical protein